MLETIDGVVPNIRYFLKQLQRYKLLTHFLDGMIVDEVLSKTPLITEEERTAALRAFLEQQELTTVDSLKNWLRGQGMTREDLETLALRSLRIEKFKESKFGAQVEGYFLKRKATFDQVLYSLIRVKERGVAQELYFRVLEGEKSFGELASQYSAGPEAYTQGLVGPVPLGNTHPAIAQLLSRMQQQERQLWPPTQIEDWFIILRLEKFFPARLDESMRRQLLNKLFRQWLKEQREQLLTRLELTNAC